MPYLYISEETLVCGAYDMTELDKMDDDTIVRVAKSLGYDQEKSTEIEKYKTQISEMDQWDISKILFFGRTWEQY